MSVQETYPAVPFNDRIEIHVDRRKAAIIAAALIAVGLAIALPPAAHQSLSASGAEAAAATIALTGAAALFAAGLHIFMRTTLWRGPAVVIDGFGIHDRRSGAIMMPWSAVRDIRVLDRHGNHIGIDLENSRTAPTERSFPALPVAWRRDHAGSLTVIDTFLLRSPTGNRVLDFVMPMTALTPLDLSETPVSAETLAEDAGIARRRVLTLWCFVIAAGVIPAVAAVSIVS
jgi:hypothetical protein